MAGRNEHVEPLTADVATQDSGGVVSNAIGVEYALIRRGGILLQVPVDSEVYTSAVNPYENPGGQLDDPPAAVRVDEAIRSMPAETWDEAKDKPFDELMDLVSSACATAYPTDAEEVRREGIEEDTHEGTDEGTEEDTDDDTEKDSEDSTEDVTNDSPITIDIQLPTDIFIADTVELGHCRGTAAAGPRFCVRDTSLQPGDQVLWVDELCAARYRPRQCKHVSLEIEDRTALGFAVWPGAKFKLARLCRAGDASEDTLEDDSSLQNFQTILPSFSRCHHQESCGHTKVADAENSRMRCALPIRLLACLANPGFPSQRGLADNEYAFRLLRDIMSAEAAERPPRIGWTPLVWFVALAHKYAAYVGDKPLEQARRWVTAIKPPSSFDESVIPWLWVLWKLHMIPEFKKLSVVVQQHAKAPVAFWQDGPENVFGIKLPAEITGKCSADFAFTTITAMIYQLI